jgi:hypothetical protein
MENTCGCRGVVDSPSSDGCRPTLYGSGLPVTGPRAGAGLRASMEKLGLFGRLWQSMPRSVLFRLVQFSEIVFGVSLTNIDRVSVTIFITWANLAPTRAIFIFKKTHFIGH